MKLRLLGSGTSSGVPRIGNDWGACDPSEPRNRRTRASLLVEADGTRLLVDTSPDLREQLLAANVGTVDAILWTHDHADHTHGIDDVRQIYHALGHPVPGFARPATKAAIEAKFGYVTHGNLGYPPTIVLEEMAESRTFGAISCHIVDQPHGDITSAGMRFESGRKTAGYATDFNVMTDPMRALYSGLDVWIVDALRSRPHPSHPTLDQVIGWAAELRPKRTVLMHMDQSMDYATLRATLPTGIEPGFDGMEIVL